MNSKAKTQKIREKYRKTILKWMKFGCSGRQNIWN